MMHTERHTIRPLISVEDQLRQEAMARAGSVYESLSLREILSAKPAMTHCQPMSTMSSQEQQAATTTKATFRAYAIPVIA